MKTAGFCFGATTMQYTELDCAGKLATVVRTVRIPHEGNPRQALFNFFKGEERPRDIDRIAVTGRAFRKSLALSSISEPEAVECALHRIYRDKNDFPEIVISSGGETQLVYTINRSGGISSVLSGNKCASGTGEFFLQQIRRMGLTLQEAVALAEGGTPHRIAGRCSVFCKSDCTHALNKGESKANIAAGLCLMMAEKIHELIKDVRCEKIALIGGGSLNTAMIKHLRERYPQIMVPEHAAGFEAYGAALWATEHECEPLPKEIEQVVKHRPESFSQHRPLSEAVPLVEFKKTARDIPRNGDQCILGLDVGSTTTKAVLMRKNDKMVVASIYLRTNGDPVQASRNCYREIRQQLEGRGQIEILGLGVTGSGRQIAALHGLTDNVINEIIAHAAAATFYDPEVDTIFEIGGQDAKYTYLTNGIASDYAMNEACSAGTGSFLEESAQESLNVKTEAIAEWAIRGKAPPNFTDQCAAFISSDIKVAGQEGIGKEDILAGLVYSICLNYQNRVKGSRAVGRKIFMQGGVCYNKAVPLAMASLMKTPIIVPPEPGLMGAFGVALEVSNRIDRGLCKVVHFNLDELVDRDALREGSFVCGGGREKCDRKCEIARIRINDKIYPFGGVCNRYYNMRLNREVNAEEFDLVAIRQRLLFEEYGVPPRAKIAEADRPDRPARTVGIMRSFLVQSMYPLYSNFFDQLGFSIVYSDAVDTEGIARIESAFCLPAEITHGSFYNLLLKKPDYIFLPQVAQIPVPNVPTFSRACVFVQGEPYYLRTTFRSEIELSGASILSPFLKMDTSYGAAEEAIVEMAGSIGIGGDRARKAWGFACERQLAYESALVEQGLKALSSLDARPEMFGIVLFGRPYSAFSPDASKGIPHKVASRGVMVIPFDMLPAADIPVHKKMYWGMGQKLMKAAAFVQKRENLFGFFTTNFSCGPDSFILGYFRRLMAQKPSLTLEVDQHTADAGIDTRVEAALDIMTSYRRISAGMKTERSAFRPARVVYDKTVKVISSDGRQFALTDPEVEVVLPSMGRYATEAIAAVLRGKGIRTRALPVAAKDELLEGRRHATCKECLPYLVTTGSFMNYLKGRENKNVVTLLFMATGGGPCRLGQYCTAMEHIIEKNRIENAASFGMTDENGYAGLGARMLLKAWQGMMTADIINDIRSMLAVTALDPEKALAVFESEWQRLLRYFEGRISSQITTMLSLFARKLSKIPLKKSPDEVPVISLVGEIFVRRDEFSRKNLVDYLENAGFMVRVAPVTEFLEYSNWVLNTGLGDIKYTPQQQIKMRLTSHIQEYWEWRIKSTLAKSGLYKFELIEIEKTIESARHLIKVQFRGEAILTVGCALREILHDSCGIVSLGPFGCMPSRMAESILKKEMNVEGKRRVPGWEKQVDEFADLGEFPFFALETDGLPFPQLIEANLEAFLLQARRVHTRLMELKGLRKKRLLRHHPIVKLYKKVTGMKEPELTAK